MVKSEMYHFFKPIESKPVFGANAVVNLLPALLHNVLISSLLLLMDYYFAHKSVDFISGHDSQQKGVNRARGLEKTHTSLCLNKTIVI